MHSYPLDLVVSTGRISAFFFNDVEGSWDTGDIAIPTRYSNQVTSKSEENVWDVNLNQWVDTLHCVLTARRREDFTWKINTFAKEIVAGDYILQHMKEDLHVERKSSLQLRMRRQGPFLDYRSYWCNQQLRCNKVAVTLADGVKAWLLPWWRRFSAPTIKKKPFGW